MSPHEIIQSWTSCRWWYPW